MKIRLSKIVVTGDLHPRISVFPNGEDDFFDGRLKHFGDVQEYGISEKDVRYIVSSYDYYYSIDDIVKQLQTYNVDNFVYVCKDICEVISIFAPSISSAQAKDVLKSMDEETRTKWTHYTEKYLD